MTTLPYIFSLLYDFEYLEQLHKHLTGEQRNATSATDYELIALANDTGVPLPEGINSQPPLAVVLKSAGARVPPTATHVHIAAVSTRRGGITSVSMQFFRKDDPGVWMTFSTDSDDEYPRWETAEQVYKPGAFAAKILPHLFKLEGNK